EVLAPVGDFERLKAAIRFGADAVYLGSTEYGMRVVSANFDFAALSEATQYAHERNVRVYLTCNTLPNNQEMERLGAFLKAAAQCGVDAFIISDIGVLAMAKEFAPEVEIHISTQAGIVNAVTANEFYRMGAKRVVLARELSLKDIRYIRDHTPPELEIEAFVHGAMCMSFSGRCLLSSYLTNRDANRGECAQPCRWEYYLVEGNRPDQPMPIMETEKGSYILNAKDLCMLEHINQVIEAGATSLKIEGRAKSSYYVSVITNAYRIAVNSYLANPKDWKSPSWLSDEVQKVSHRGYSTGFYLGRPEQGQRYDTGGYIRNCDIVAVVDDWSNGRAICTQKNKFLVGDRVELLEPGKQPFSVTISALYDENGESIDDTKHAHMKFSFPLPQSVLVGTIVRKETND
ncbi:MAG: U32 family peptidase, partial [Oscillospiraceae bacterium]